MTSSRAALRKPIIRSGSRETAFSVENPYKPGFLDPSTPESFKMSVDAELSSISNAFYQNAEVTSNLPSDEDLGEIEDSLDQIKSELDVLEQEVIRIETETEAGFASIEEELVILGDTDTLLAQQITDLQVSTDAGFAEVHEELNVLVDADTAMAQRITDLEVSTDQGFASIEEDMSVIADDVAGLEAKWSITADVDGKISGIELTNDGVYSQFVVMADAFIVTDGTENSEPPFQVVNGSTRIQSAYVNTLQSDNWDGGSNGWFISNAGDANFQNITIRGDITADTFTGVGASGKYFYIGGITQPTPGGSVDLATFPINNTTGKPLYVIGTLPNVDANGNYYAHLKFRPANSTPSVTLDAGLGQFIIPEDATDFNYGFETTHTHMCTATVGVGWSGDLILYYENNLNPGSEGSYIMPSYTIVQLMVAG